MADVFLNYARQDENLARTLIAGLTSRDLSVWSDADLRGGDLVVEAIQDAMARSACVLTLWSRNSVGSSWVRAEAGWAIERGKLLPVAIDEVEIPHPFRTVQTAFLRLSESDWLDRLAEDVRRFVLRSDRRGAAAGPPPPEPPGPDSSRPQPAAAKEPKKAFVSYAEEDEETAIDLVQHLEASNCPCWISLRDVDPGDDYRRSIVTAMNEVRFLVLVYSQFVNTSFDIATELILARKRGLRRLVLRMDATTPDGPVEYELATVQWIDGTGDRKSAFDRISRRAALL